MLIIFGALLQFERCCSRAFFMIYISFFRLVFYVERSILATLSERETNVLLRGCAAVSVPRVPKTRSLIGRGVWLEGRGLNELATLFY